MDSSLILTTTTTTTTTTRMESYRRSLTTHVQVHHVAITAVHVAVVVTVISITTCTIMMMNRPLWTHIVSLTPILVPLYKFNPFPHVAWHIKIEPTSTRLQLFTHLYSVRMIFFIDVHQFFSYCRIQRGRSAAGASTKSQPSHKPRPASQCHCHDHDSRPRR